MSVTIILTCDCCGQTGHDEIEPSKACLQALQDKINQLESELSRDRLSKFPRRNFGYGPLDPPVSPGPLWCKALLGGL